jgi:hypothetical protein
MSYDGEELSAPGSQFSELGAFYFLRNDNKGSVKANEGRLMSQGFDESLAYL